MSVRVSVFGALSLSLLMVAGAANAQATRTWVSGVGDDVNPCSRTAPCKTFAGAISKTAAGGEINVLDPGGFGGVTITKSLTIDGRPFESSSLSPSVNGIVVNAGVNDTVTLRNLQINGVNTGLNGIRYVAGKQLNVENVAIFGFGGNPGRGIDVALGNGAVGTLTVKDSTIHNNAGTGIVFLPLAGNVPNITANIVNTAVHSNGSASGIFVSTGAKVTISNSNIMKNGFAGVSVDSTGVAFIDRCNLSNNGRGIQMTAGTVRLAGSTITGNTVNGLEISGGTIFTLGNNAIAGNTGNNGAGMTGVGGLQ